MKFKDTVIFINGVAKFASEATISEAMQVTRIPELFLKKVNTAPSSRIGGSFSATYYLNDNDTDVRSLTGINLCYGGLGEIGFENGLLKSYSINVGPYDVLQATVSFDFFSPIKRDFIAISAPETGIAFAHGSRSSVSTIVFNNNPFEFNYSLEQSIDAVYPLGNSGAIQYNFQEGQESCSLRGRSINDAIEFCGDDVNIVLTLKDTCNISLGTIGVSGLKITDGEMSLNNDENLTSSVNLIRYF